jgi:hypothetical protein
VADEYEFMKRGYLLPEGCKDLTYASNLRAQPSPKLAHGGPLPPPPLITSEMTFPAWLTVTELAAALSKKPFQIVGDLMKLGFFVTVTYKLDFETISKLVRYYGIDAKRAA